LPTSLHLLHHYFFLYYLICYDYFLLCRDLYASLTVKYVRVFGAEDAGFCAGLFGEGSVGLFALFP
jgi:hypothetical protein